MSKQLPFRSSTLFFFARLGVGDYVKKKGVVLELITERKLHDIIDKGIRGGICCFSKKYAEASNKYLNNFDARKPPSYIFYLDMSKLYETAMTQPLPEGNFKFIPIESTTLDEILSTDDESTSGYILEVDLDYLSNLYDLHNDYPSCPENVKINQEDLAPYTVELSGKLNVNCGKSKKLMCNLKNKQRYTVHYK